MNIQHPTLFRTGRIREKKKGKRKSPTAVISLRGGKDPGHPDEGKRGGEKKKGKGL